MSPNEQLVLDKVNARRKIIAWWLITVAILVALMIVLGGATRLTRSGLSMVDWKPLSRFLPPLSHSEWVKEFERYKRFPEYKLIHKHFTLADFKKIYAFEFSHRALGRLIGIVYGAPFLIFSVMGWFSLREIFKYGFGFLLGAFQGIVGWYMVKSGLSSIPSVSHYRLAFHLFMAFVLLGYLLWIIADELRVPPYAGKRRKVVRGLVYALMAVLLVQLVFGAFVAGKRAGFVYNTFPLMNGRLIPDELFLLKPAYMNFLENGVTIQFVHRAIAFLMALIIALIVLVVPYRSLSNKLKALYLLLPAVFVVQFILGVSVILYQVPLGFALAHQFGAEALFSVVVIVSYTLSKRASSKRARHTGANTLI
ncbi:MAG: heme A synthase [Candidatus Dadabacteria bacterium]|nr:MAG: heme A synthase [Candidatus Dadabacteria bacterium]